MTISICIFLRCVIETHGCTICIFLRYIINSEGISRTMNVTSVIFLGWRVLVNRIATKVNLLRRNALVGDVICSLCTAADESTFHLLFVCSFSWQVWSLVLKWLGFHFVSPGAILDHFNQFVGTSCCSNKVGLALIWLAVVHQIWTGRNGVIFRGNIPDPVVLFDLIKSKAWEWLRAKNKRFLHSFSEWCMEPIACLSDM